ncbi:family 16 glycoside hydrolase [Chryseolinea sp. H1M3-3]|uniref:family 16 glycoside hydrolase n=1 Tax=Chryseolinea sp. H1M3-3 TaxID=3034144 RepID=UPI0023EB7017|nr:family 16 glycoside hydrolase [Chryseolinea sp. H1M3-3]
MKKIVVILLLLFAGIDSSAQKGAIQMKAGNFDFKAGTVEFLTYKGRQSMKLAANSGQVVIKDMNFKNGIIEFDVESILPGFAQSVYFHRKDEKEQEIVYLRVTKIGDKLANEAIQYAPYFDGVNMWDMYPQYQAPAPIKKDDWNHMKLVIHGKRMRVYVNDVSRPVLEIPQLEGNLTEGTIAFDGAGYISNLVVRPNETDGLSAEAAPDLTDHRSNYIRTWAVTQPELLETGREVTTENLPDDRLFKQNIRAEREGLVNLTRKYGMNEKRKVIWLKAVIESAIDQPNSLDIGFSDEVWIFLNNSLLSVDKNLFQHQILKYPKGRISIENAKIPLRLKKGTNELAIAVANDFYGWGIIVRLQSTDNILSIEPYVPAPEVAIENIALYLGEYKTTAVPFTLKFTEQNGQLVGKTSNENTFGLNYRGNHEFENKTANLKIVFMPKENKLFFKPGDQLYEFTRQ